MEIQRKIIEKGINLLSGIKLWINKKYWIGIVAQW